MPPNPLTNFEIQKYYKKEPRFNSAYSRNNLPEKVKDGTYILNPLMKMQTLIQIGLLYFVTEVKLFISIVSVLNMLLKKFKILSAIKI